MWVLVHTGQLLSTAKLQTPQVSGCWLCLRVILPAGQTSHGDYISAVTTVLADLEITVCSTLISTFPRFLAIALERLTYLAGTGLACCRVPQRHGQCIKVPGHNGYPCCVGNRLRCMA